ncbi:PCMD domain-containing protein [Bacteroides congonensis]|uniref:PCMD domain-containing protein n=1 Tax=Bacteroides congonensis TaxID=1871006 RepID=UPI002FDAD4F0
MKLKNVFAGMIMCLAITSCIQDEGLNVEAAIDGCNGSNIQLSTINTYSKTVSIYVSKATDLSTLEIQFELPEGADIEPVDAAANDHAPKYDFSNSKVPVTSEQTLEQYQRKFRVTSESRTTEAVYMITVIKSELPTEYHFENIEDGNNKYHIFYEFNLQKAEMLQWASGNPGFNLTGMARSPLDYITIQSQGYIGKGAKLETKSTGSFGAGVSMPIAAGNLFIGSFEVGNALKDAMKATKFGFPFYKHPTRLSGYYKFKPGTDYTSYTLGSDGKKNFFIDASMNGKDKGDIYAVLYEADNVEDFLDGYNSLNSPKIVSLARIKSEDVKETSEWTSFDLPFVLQNNKTINDNMLAAGKYKLAIVFSSSVEGAAFKGSVGFSRWGLSSVNL